MEMENWGNKRHIGRYLMLVTVMLLLTVALSTVAGGVLSAALLASDTDVQGSTPDYVAPGAPLVDVIGPQTWVVLLCKFADVPAEPQSSAYFESMFERSSGPSIQDFWNQVSYGNVSVSADVFGWYTLPQPRSGYGFSEGTAGYNAGTLAQDCANAADADVDFTQYDGAAMMLNSPSPVAIWTALFTPPDGAFLPFYAITMPSNKFNLAIVAHEMGHGYGLPHSYGGGTEYNDPWDLMGSTSGYRCSVNADPVYSCLGQHTIAYFKDDLGWIPPEHKFTATGGEQTITLEQLAQPQTGNYLMGWIEVEAGNGIMGYTVEARRRVGYDAKLAGDAVIIHKVLASGTPDLIDADGGAMDDAGSMWTPGETFTDAANDISIHVDSATATGFVVTINTPLQVPDLSPSSAWASSTHPAANEVVTFTARLVNQGTAAANVMVSAGIPNHTDYVPGSASTSQGSVSGTGPLSFDIGDVANSGMVTLSFAATVQSNVLSPTVISAPIAVTWEGGSLDLSWTVIANGLPVYLPVLSR